jgi:hypothetical protein
LDFVEGLQARAFCIRALFANEKQELGLKALLRKAKALMLLAAELRSALTKARA